MKKTIMVLIAAALVVSAAAAQYQGRIAGRVLDPASNPVDKAEVSIVSQKTVSIHYEVKTDKEGRFLQVGLMPGYYLVSVKKEGFGPSSLEVHVGVADEQKIEVRLKAFDSTKMSAYSEADKLFLKGNTLYAEQKYPESAEAYRQAIEKNPASWGYHLNLGLSLKKLNKLEDALAAFEKAVELSPESFSANKETGEALAKSGRIAEAKPYYEKAAGLSPDDPDAHYNLGMCLLGTGESEAALTRFQKAAELKPDYADAYYQMGTVLIGQNKVPEAIASLEKFLALAPDHEKAGVAKQLLQYLKK